MRREQLYKVPYVHFRCVATPVKGLPRSYNRSKTEEGLETYDDDEEAAMVEDQTARFVLFGGRGGRRPPAALPPRLAAGPLHCQSPRCTAIAHLSAA